MSKVTSSVMRSLLRWAKDLYLSAYLVILRTSLSKGDFNIYGAMSLLSLLIGAVILDLFLWGEMRQSRYVPLKKWAFVGGYGLIYVSHYLWLFREGEGSKFEQRFSTFRTGKKIFLLSAGVLAIVAAVTVTYLTVARYVQVSDMGKPCMNGSAETRGRYICLVWCDESIEQGHANLHANAFNSDCPNLSTLDAQQ